MRRARGNSDVAPDEADNFAQEVEHHDKREAGIDNKGFEEVRRCRQVLSQRAVIRPDSRARQGRKEMGVPGAGEPGSSPGHLDELAMLPNFHSNLERAMGIEPT